MFIDKFHGKARTVLIALGVFTIYFASIGANAMDPALHDLQNIYTGVSHEQIASLITVPNLAAIPGSILSGLFTGRKLKYRTVLSSAFFLIIAGGFAPMFFTSFTGMILCRYVLGFGLGLLWPLGNALIIDLFPSERRAYMFGIGEVVKNVALIVLQMLVGVLVGIHVQISWSAYLVLILVYLVLFLFLPEPQVRESGKKVPLRQAIHEIPKRLYAFVVFLCLCMIMQTVYQLNMSSIIVTEKLGNAETAATVLSTATLTAMVAALCFGFIQKILKNFTITFSCAALGLGTLLISLAPSLTEMYGCAIIVGIGIGTMESSFYVKIADCSNTGNAALISGFQVVFSGLGGYLPHYFLGLVQSLFHSSSLRLPITCGAFVLLTVAIGFAIIYIMRLGKRGRPVMIQP